MDMDVGLGLTGWQALSLTGFLVLFGVWQLLKVWWRGW